ncbi:uncharacterized protein topaz1 isoform X2 [Halichoeres trimaculatus]|uniref:uncharacterized protein topaz1 isoform X2 n=1 Tax=Halichoeres trimaculatus TaxID=147232 RepID=UPI003D9E0F33
MLTGTRSVPNGLSNTDRSTHSTPTGPTDSEEPLRRAVRASGCGLCGDCTYTEPQWKAPGKTGHKSSGPGPGKPTVDFSPEEKNKTTQKSVLNRSLKVTLCDILKNCDASGHNCSSVLPDVLKTKALRCFKQEMRASLRFGSGCSDSDKKENEKDAHTSNGEKKVCQPKHLSNTTECTAFTKRASANCSASLTLDKSATNGECMTDMKDRNTEQDSGPGCALTRVTLCRGKRKKLSGCTEDGSLPSSSDSINNGKLTTENGEGKAHFWVSYDSRLGSEYAQYAGSSTTVGPDMTENEKQKLCVRKRSPRDDAVRMLPELFNQSDEVTTDEPESFTCQRVRVFKRRIPFSCARTHMPWPFPKCSQTLTANAGTAQSAEHVDPVARDNCDSSENQKQSNLSSSSSNDAIPDLPIAFFGDVTTQLISFHGRNIFTERNGTAQDDLSPHSSVRKDMEFAEESQASFSSDTTYLSHPSQYEPVSPSSPPVNYQNTDSFLSTLSPRPLGLSDWKTAPSFSPVSTLLTNSWSSRLSNTPPSLTPSVSLLSPVKSDEMAANQSAYTSPVHTQEEQESNEELISDSSPPKLEPYYKTSPINYERALLKARSLHSALSQETYSDFVLPPALSPVTSPTPHSSIQLQSPDCSDDEEEELHQEPSQLHSSPGSVIPQIVYSSAEDSENDVENSGSNSESVSGNSKSLSGQKSSPSTDEDSDHDDPNITATPDSSSQATSSSSSCSGDDDVGSFGDEDQLSSPREELMGPCEASDQSKVKAAGDPRRGVLDELTAFEQDILLVDVIQDDKELFENLPQKSLLKLGPNRITETLKTRKDKASVDLLQRLNPVKIVFKCDSPDGKDESNSRSWRPQSSSNSATRQSCTWTAREKLSKTSAQPDANNNHINGGLERSQPIQTVISQHNRVPALTLKKNGPWNNLTNMAELRHKQPNSYCRQYFSESLSCGFKTCWSLHVPMDGDEKFCIETVVRFTKNPMCLQKAVAVFTGYYQNNPPGVYFSMPVLLCLLWALLRASMVSDVFSVLSVSLAHKIVPGHEFVLALFNFVREKGLMGLVPELMQLTFKMANAGLVLNLDCLDCVKNTPEFQKMNSHVSVLGNQNLPTSGPFPEYLNLAHSIVEIELCSKQEDWRRMGEVFRSICQSSQRTNQVERICGRIAIALLSESKDKLSLPFAAFAETVCQNEEGDSLHKSFLGRIGVSLMLRYHKTHQWSKGRKVVEVLSSSRVNYPTLKGLFGNEDGASRCYLVTVATELFLLSGSVEGALNTLRENKWFVSSTSWPCEPADLESRTRVLIRLAEKSSHRDSFDVLSNLPGLKEPSNFVDPSMYTPLFHSHLRVCLDRQTLPVASDTVDFMLSKNLAVDHAMLHMLLHKLGKQNLWLRAREVFRHALNAGYYPGVSAPPGFMSLIIPPHLGEVELALTLEMFITVNATVLLQLQENTTSFLSIILKRTQSCESEYLSAGSRLLSAACIPQPKLILHYTAVNSSQEQVFSMDISSARLWLRHNHLWANEVWAY